MSPVLCITADFFYPMTSLATQLSTQEFNNQVMTYVGDSSGPPDDHENAKDEDQAGCHRGSSLDLEI